MTMISAAALLLALQGGWTGSAPWQMVSAQAGARPPSSSGEILLELAGMGIESARADLATLTVTVRATGTTSEAARSAHDAILGRVTAAAGQAGVAASDIDRAEVTSGTSIGVMAFDVEEAPPPEEPAADAANAEDSGTAYSSFKVRVRDVSRVAAVIAAIEAAGGEVGPIPEYSLQDSSAARRAARGKALAQVRADAEAYAAALNMRVVRIDRITEREGFDFMGAIVSEVTSGPQRLRQIFEAKDGMVPTTVFVGVDFILAPR